MLWLLNHKVHRVGPTSLGQVTIANVLLILWMSPSHLTFSLQHAVFPQTCKDSSLRGAPGPASVPLSERSASSGSSGKSPQLSSENLPNCPQILHALLPMFSSPLLSFSQLQFCIIYMVVWLTLSQDHKLEKGLLLFCGSLCLHGVWSRAWCSMGICWMTMTVILLCFCLGDGSFKRLLNWAEIWLTSSTWGPASSHTSCM